MLAVECKHALDQGWGEVAGYISYKSRREGIRVVEVYAGGTSQTCSQCGHRHKDSRNHEHFQCLKCGHQADADVNAALNIGERGTYIYVQRKGVTLEQIRQQRLDRTDGDTPERQEPGTGLDDAPPAHPTGLTSFHPAQHSNSSLLTVSSL